MYILTTCKGCSRAITIVKINKYYNMQGVSRAIWE